MPATYKDIQRLTGFSLSTISRYFNGENVKPATRKAIQEAASRLDFKMNDFARGLKSRRAMTVGLLIPDLNSAFCTNIMYQAGRLLRHSGYGCFVCDCNSDKSVEIDAMNFLINKSVDGIITIPFDTNPVHLQSARTRDIPIILIDNAIPSFETDAVVIDNFDAGKTTSEYLMKMGHKRMAIISGLSELQSMRERQKGFSSLFPESGYGYYVHTIDTNFTIEGGYQAVNRLLINSREITALFCTNYELTLGAVTAMNELGIKFPDDISLAGFDNMQLTGIIKPALTIIEQPMDLIARQAVDLLLKRLENGTTCQYETVILKSKLIYGASVADLRQD
jgi:LacI family transcriptional regulator